MHFLVSEVPLQTETEANDLHVEVDRRVATTEADDHISHKVFLKPFCKSQFTHKSVNLFFISVIVQDE